MLSNRSVPPCTIIPVLHYPDVSAAADWLCKAFGFIVRLRIGNHRIQLKFGDGCLVVAEGKAPSDSTHLVLVRVSDARSHCEHACQCGARIPSEPADHPYGERQYNAEDFAGHRWTFTQSIADVTPEEWGGTSVNL
ncbi:MAG: glyoxalase [Acidobacteria bacterium]|nr:MAG: glyoxalase [Acidobacteriota bacterium]